jgi:hypothetical protein
MKVLKDVLLESGEIDQYFEGRVPVALWRAKRNRSPDHPFHFVEEPIIHDDGTRRGADIKIDVGPDGRRWVRIEFRPRGISTFDKPRTFKGKQWEYYKIEGGTQLPRGLAIVKDYFNRTYGAWHYTIAPAWDMPLDSFKELLRQLAEKLVKEVG